MQENGVASSTSSKVRLLKIAILLTFDQFILECEYIDQGTHCTGKTGNMAKKIPVRENTGNLEILPKHREFGLLRL